MRPPLNGLRRTRLWNRMRDIRYLLRHRARRRFLAGFIGRNDLVFDIGANIGHFTLMARSLGARVLAVEPQAALAAELRHRFAGSPRVQVLQCALSSSAGTAPLHKTAELSEVASLREDIGERSRFAIRHPYSLSETVDVMTLEELIGRFGRPSFCKIDVEGHESSVLAGLKTAVARMSFEFASEYRDDTSRCLGLLSALGPYRFNYALGEDTRLAEPGWLEASQVERMISSLTDPHYWGDLYAQIKP